MQCAALNLIVLPDQLRDRKHWLTLTAVVFIIISLSPIVFYYLREHDPQTVTRYLMGNMIKASPSAYQLGPVYQRFNGTSIYKNVMRSDRVVSKCSTLSSWRACIVTLSGCVSSKNTVKGIVNRKIINVSIMSITTCFVLIIIKTVSILRCICDIKLGRSLVSHWSISRQAGLRDRFRPNQPPTLNYPLAWEDGGSFKRGGKSYTFYRAYEVPACNNNYLFLIKV